MGYSILTEEKEPTPIRLVRPDGTLAQQFTPEEWWCDPCSRWDARYRVKHPGGWAEYPWYAVVVCTDSQADIDAKTTLQKKITEAEDTAREASNAVLKLKRGW